MFSHNRQIWQIVGLTVAFLLPAVAQADPIVITSGQASVQNQLINTGQISLTGRNFALTGFLNDGNFAPFVCGAAPLPGACTPGTQLSLHGLWAGLSVGFEATFNDEQFTGGSLDDGPGRANFLAEFFGEITLPAWTGDSAEITAPFMFGGILSHSSGSGDDFRFFNQEVVGRGTATVSLAPYPEFGNQQLWNVRQVVYDFDPDAAPVPEPGTLLLLGLGLASVGRRIRRNPSPR